MHLLELLVPVMVERSPVGRPHLRRHLQRGAEHYRFFVATIGVAIVHLADEHPIKVHPALVKASGHPQLQIGVERVVLHGAVRSRVHLGVRAAHPPPKSAPLLSPPPPPAPAICIITLAGPNSRAIPITVSSSSGVRRGRRPATGGSPTARS